MLTSRITEGKKRREKEMSRNTESTTRIIFFSLVSTNAIFAAMMIFHSETWMVL